MWLKVEKMRVVYVIALALVSAILVGGCVQFQTNVSTGPATITRESRTVASFTSIDFALPGTLYITQNNTQSAAVEAKNSVVPTIRTDVTNGILKIDATSPIPPITTPLTIFVSVTDINSITNRGAGTVLSSAPLNTKALNVTLLGAGSIDIAVNVTQLTTQVSGVGTVLLRGNATTHTAMLTGVGSLRSYELQTDTTTVSITGVGSAEVTAVNALTVNISGTGSVNYHGSPQLTVQRTGLGVVQKTG
jgi:hypothetical protein